MFEYKNKYTHTQKKKGKRNKKLNGFLIECKNIDRPQMNFMHIYVFISHREEGEDAAFFKKETFLLVKKNHLYFVLLETKNALKINLMKRNNFSLWMN